MIGLLALLWRQVGSIAKRAGHPVRDAGRRLPSIERFPGRRARIFLPAALHLGLRLTALLQLRWAWQTILPVWQEWGVVVVLPWSFTAVSRYLLKKRRSWPSSKGSASYKKRVFRKIRKVSLFIYTKNRRFFVYKKVISYFFIALIKGKSRNIRQK